MEKKKIENLVNWFKEKRNVNFDDFSSLRVKSYEGMGYGINYAGNEKEYRYGGHGGSILLWVPYHLMLSRENIGKETDFLRQLNFDSDKVKAAFRASYEKLNNRPLNLDLKEHEIDEALLAMFLVYCKNNKRKENYWKPYTDFLCDLPEQGDFQYMKNDYYETVLPTIKEIYKTAGQKIKERMKNPNKDDSECRWAYSLVKTRASKFVDPNDGKVGNAHMIPFFDFLNHKKREIININSQEQEEKAAGSFTIYYNNYDGKNNVFISPQPDEFIKLANNEQVFLYYGEDLKHHGIMEEVEKPQLQEQQAQIEILPK